MTLVHRLIAPALIAALSVASLAVMAAESTPVGSAPGASALISPQARVIVKYKADAGNARILSTTANGARVPQQAKALGTRLGLTLVDGRGMDSQTQLVHASGISSAALAERLAQDANVEWAVPDRRVRAKMVPNDTLYGSQWYLHAPIASSIAATNTEGAWDKTLGAGQVVAVLDTGIRPEHPDLLGSRLLTGYNMISLNTSTDGADAAGKCLTGNGVCRGVGAVDPGDWVSPADHTAHPTLFSNDCLIQDSSGAYVQSPSSWHGTQVAGIVGANTNNNGIGVAGIASEAKILPVRVLGKCGGWDTDIVEGIKWAAGLSVSGISTLNPNPATVINLSLGGPASAGACGPLYQGVIDAVIAKGIVVVAAAGNDGLGVGTPGNCTGVITVAAVQHSGTKADYSSLGSNVTLSAPGGDCASNIGACQSPILSTFNDGLTGPSHSIYTDALNNVFQGTSFSAPQVSGTVALMLSVNPKLSPAQVSGILGSTARAFPSSGAGGTVAACRDPALFGVQDKVCYCTAATCGAGMLDTNAAVTQAAGAMTAAISATPGSLQAGQQVALDASGSTAAQGRTIAGYLWEITAGSGIAVFKSATNAATATLDTTGAGTVTVRLTITDNLGGMVSTSKTLTVSSVSFSAAISATASGANVALDSAGSTVPVGRSISSYLWEITSGGTLASFSGATNASTASLVTSGNGDVIVKLTLTDSEGLQATATKTLTVGSGSAGGGSSGGGGAWSPLWSLGLLLAALALPGRRQRRG